MSTARRGKWPPPPPSPRILHLHRRSRLSSRPSRPPPPHPPSSRRSPPQQNLGSLLDQERPVGFTSFFGDQERRRDRKIPDQPPRRSDAGEERWRVEAEILRAECKFLRLEREVAIQELAQNRERMETSIRSAFSFLVSSRKKIDGSAATTSDEEIGDLVEKLEGLNVSSGRRWGRCKPTNFDMLRRRLETKEVEPPRNIQVISNRCDGTSCRRNYHNVEKLRRKMERLSRGMTVRMEEYGLLLSATAGSGAAIVAKRRVRSHHLQADQERERCCNCKEVLARVVEQVKAETEQWNEIQAMLQQLRGEMDDLHSSRDLWQRRATTSDFNLRSLHSHMIEWRQRALLSERRAAKLKESVSSLQSKLYSMKDEKENLSSLQSKLYSMRDENSSSPSSSGAHSDIWIPKQSRMKALQQQVKEKEKEKEKHVLVCRLKKEDVVQKKRLPLQDIENSSRLY